MENERSCPVCLSDKREVLYVTPTEQHINCCLGCGMVYADNSAPVDYANDSIYTCAETYPWQREHYEEIVKRCSSGPRGSVLDIGCATGGLMKAFIAAGHETVDGRSISEKEVAYCHSIGLVAAVEGHPGMGYLPYDLVTVCHVLEHVPDVAGFLRGVRQWVKPNGRLYIEVPDATSYTSHFTSICQGFNSEHINHFDHNHLCEALLRSGFQVLNLGHYRTPITGTENYYPCVWAIAEPRWFSPRLRTAIESYRDGLIPQLKTVGEKLKKRLEGIENIAVWGMGQTTQMLIQSGALEAFRIVAATDTNPIFHGKPIGRCTVSPPEFFHPHERIPIVVCSQNSQAAIIARIRELGLTNPIITLEGE